MERQKKRTKTSKVARPKAGQIVIEQNRLVRVGLEVSGDSMIQNHFSQKAVEEMLRKHMGISVIRDKKRPREILDNSRILNTEDRICVPPEGFKKGMLSASTQIKKLPKTRLRTSLFIVGRSVPIVFEEQRPRMDMVRTAGIGRVPDVRFRYEYLNWKARLVLEFDENTISTATVVDLLNRAGRVGVGEWRPERDGTFGTFRVSRHINDPKEVAEVLEECSVPLVSLIIPEWAMDAEIDSETLREAFGDAMADASESDDEKVG